MARTEQEIITSMGSLPEGLTESNLSEMNTWRKMAARAIWFFEKILDDFSQKIDRKLATKQYGTLSWYLSKAYEFQYDNNLSVTNEGIVRYKNDKPENKIIARCAVLNKNDKVYFKVAKITNKKLNALNSDEKQQFDAYIKAISPLGIKSQVVSEPPDIINISINFVSDGMVSNLDIHDEAHNRLVAYKDEFQFNGILALSDIYAKLEGINGVAYFEIANIEWKLATSDIFESVIKKELIAGYFEFDTILINVNNNINAFS